ncbi:protein BatD [Aggregatimonas sangjinii]|uniref:Protein BatD n=1 Tax=Aggregatimonas sangjinii TaxID=2583587 RepID=A0A5B7SXX2_9FLAO|nr:BatD family protein [Aggregatimonas sangjinii]QCX02063.1 protein BatD [Aggregatimonas sangjinii]
MQLKKYICLLPLLLLAFLAKGQDDDGITFEMRLSKDKLGINERLRVDFTMNKDGDNFTPPDFKGFKVVMGPSQSISSSWYNGVRSYSKTYSYTVSPTAKGNFSIGQASIVIDGKTYKSTPKKVVVTEAVDRPNGQVTADDIADEHLHLVAEVSNSNPYLNEAISVVYKLYVSNSISASSDRTIDIPKYENFWSQDITRTNEPVRNDTYKEKPYRSKVFKRVVLYPQKSGKLEIEPFTIEMRVDVPTSRRDFFGRPVYASTTKVVSAGRRTITVKPLPEQGKPVDFTGAVGDFDFKVTTNKTSLNASESLQADVEVSGKGNLKLFQLPEPSLPSALEVYDPEFKESVRTTISGSQGKVGNSYTIVPSFRGKYPIPPISFSYFNPNTEKYNTLKSEEIIINVTSGPSNDNDPSGTVSNNKQTVTTTGNQFNFIKLTPNLSAIGSNYFFNTSCFYLWWLLPLLLIPLAIVIRNKREARAGDVTGNRLRKANRLARKYLSAAKKTLGDKDAFYVALEKALHNYLKAKLKIETSEFSKDKIASLLQEKKVDDSTKDGFIGLLKNCEMARYSQFSKVQMQQDYDLASEVISTMDKQL